MENKDKKKILFISRAFPNPPKTGGLEKYNFELARSLEKQVNVRIISNKHGKSFLPIFLPIAFLKSCYLILTQKFDLVVLGDALLSPLGLILKLVKPKQKIYSIVVGLDITYNFPLYTQIVSCCLNRLDKVIVISRSTKKKCVERGVEPKKIVIIPPGLDINEFKTNKTKQELKEIIEKKFNLNLKNKKVLLTIGRLVKRKGHEWFIRSVAPKLNKDTIYLIAGTGEEKENIERAINQNKLSNSVYILGWIAEEMKKYLLNYADLFIMPNIKVRGDMEGFGIVALEASSVGLPVIAAKLEGIKDVVKKDKNGILLKAEKTDEFIKSIKFLIENKNRLKELSNDAREYAKRFEWENIAKKYLELVSI